MEEMVLTWRTGSPSRFELFGAQHQLSIEQGIWGDGGSGHVSFVSLFKVINMIDDICLVERQSDNESPSPQRTSVCARPEGAWISSQPIRPKWTEPHRHTVTGATLPIRIYIHLQLSQLRKLVETSVFQAELQQILNQLPQSRS